MSSFMNRNIINACFSMANQIKSTFLLKITWNCSLRSRAWINIFDSYRFIRSHIDHKLEMNVFLALKLGIVSKVRTLFNPRFMSEMWKVFMGHNLHGSNWWKSYKFKLPSRFSFRMKSIHARLMLIESLTGTEYRRCIESMTSTFVARIGTVIS